MLKRWSVLSLAVAALGAQAETGCNSAPGQELLQAVAPVEAGAYWLDRRQIQWPGLSADAAASFKLLHPGGAVALSRAADAPPPERFKFIGAGPRLVVSDVDLPRLPDLLKGPLLLVQEDAAGRELARTALQIPGALDDWYAAAERVPDLGAQPGAAGTQFKLWAPTARKVALCLGNTLHDMRPDPATGVWSARLPGDASGQLYDYQLEVFAPSAGWVRNRVTDPYSVSLNANSRRSYVADLASPKLKPAGWDASQRPARVREQTDMVIYELHVRDFSIGDASVKPANRGKYLAFTEGKSAGMKHLQALSEAGLTDVHLLPVFDFATVPEAGCVTPTVPKAAPDSEAQQAAVMREAQRDCFNWGYDPLHFNAPEGSFASDASDGAKRIVEFRRMVMALHKLGLRVGMDVVYNHTSASGQHANSVLDRIVPGYYQRLDARGVVERSTCCDNTATEHRMMAKLMIDSAELWTREYKIDSFRFDLMAHQPRAAMEALQARVDAVAGARVNLIGEGWNFGEIANGARFVQASQLSLNGSGIGTFSDRGRDAARGGSAGDSGAAMVRNKGWLNGSTDAHTADLIRVGLAGSLRDFSMQVASGEQRKLADVAYGDQPAGYVSQPGEVVNYVDNHDNQTLFDINVLKLPADTSRIDRARVQVLGAALTAFSQGVAYFHAGIDVLRSKSMDRNSYDSGDWFNRLDWAYRDNGFGAGLPPKGDNGADYPLLQPPLARSDAIKPGPAEIAFARDAFRDLLRIRASSTLFRLPSAAEVQKRLRFLGTGAAQNPQLIAAALDGRGLSGAGFARVVYLLNTSPVAQALTLPEEAGRDWRLHPVHLHSGAADKRVAQAARFEPGTGRFSVPARSAVVFVLPR